MAIILWGKFHVLSPTAWNAEHMSTFNTLTPREAVAALAPLFTKRRIFRQWSGMSAEEQ
jgi:hypothetical protein